MSGIILFLLKPFNQKLIPLKPLHIFKDKFSFGFTIR